MKTAPRVREERLRSFTPQKTMSQPVRVKPISTENLDCSMIQEKMLNFLVWLVPCQSSLNVFSTPMLPSIVVVFMSMATAYENSFGVKAGVKAAKRWNLLPAEGPQHSSPSKQHQGGTQPRYLTPHRPEATTTMNNNEATFDRDLLGGRT